MRNLTIGFAALALSACEPASPENASLDNRANVAVKTTWSYREQKDDMRGTRSWSATLESDNAPHLGFPYEGGSPIRLTLWKTEGDARDPWGPQIILDNGQFDCAGGPCIPTIKFDDKAPIDIYGHVEECGRSQCMRLNSKDGTLNLVDELRRSQRVILEVSLYKYGSFQYHFSSAGLSWSAETTQQ